MRPTLFVAGPFQVTALLQSSRSEVRRFLAQPTDQQIRTREYLAHHLQPVDFKRLRSTTHTGLRTGALDLREVRRLPHARSMSIGFDESQYQSGEADDEATPEFLLPRCDVGMLLVMQPQ
jgi:hypothetical protein